MFTRSHVLMTRLNAVCPIPDATRQAERNAVIEPPITCSFHFACFGKPYRWTHNPHDATYIYRHYRRTRRATDIINFTIQNMVVATRCTTDLRDTNNQPWHTANIILSKTWYDDMMYKCECGAADGTYTNQMAGNGELKHELWDIS